MTQSQAKVQPQATQTVSVGHTSDNAEHEADRAADQASDRMGLRYPRGISSAGNPMGGEAAPESAIAATHSGGEPLDHGTRQTMERGFGQDFSNVRIHHGPQAARAASDVGADAYALGSDIVFGHDQYRPSEPAGAALLSHELAHTTADESDPTIRRGVGIGQQIARFFGGGTFHEEELEGYLDRLQGDAKEIVPGSEQDQGEIEDNYDSDNKARAVVEQGLHKTRSVKVRALLIQEMLTGFLSEADEEAIVQILQDTKADNIGDLHEIIKIVGSDVLEEELDGQDYKDFLTLRGEMRKSGPVPGVPLDWDINYNISGLNKTMGNAAQGLLLRTATSTPTGGQATTLADNTDVTQQNQNLIGDAMHDRDMSGSLFVDAVPGKIVNGKVLPIGGLNPPTHEYPAISHHYDKATIELDLFYNERKSTVDVESETTGEGTVTGTDEAKTHGSNSSTMTGNQTVTGTDETKGVTIGANSGVEVGKNASVTAGAKKTHQEGSGNSTVVGDGESKDTVDLSTKKDETDTHDLKRKTEGTNTTTGDITVDLSDVEFDASVKTAIKGTAEAEKGKESWTRKLVDLTEPIRRKILDKILKPRLGPLAGPAGQGVEWLIDKLVGDPPDWTITLDGEGKSKIKGSLDGEIKAELDIKTEVDLTETETGTVSRKGTGSVKGTVTGKSDETLTGNSTNTLDGTEDSLAVQKGADIRAKRGRSVEINKSETDVKRDVKLREETTGTFDSDTTTDVKRKTGFGSETTGTETQNYEAVFQRADLRVKLTGDGGRYVRVSEPGQRGGGEGDRSGQQKRGAQ